MSERVSTSQKAGEMNRFCLTPTMLLCSVHTVHLGHAPLNIPFSTRSSQKQPPKSPITRKIQRVVAFVPFVRERHRARISDLRTAIHQCCLLDPVFIVILQNGFSRRQRGGRDRDRVPFPFPPFPPDAFVGSRTRSISMLESIKLYRPFHSIF